MRTFKVGDRIKRICSDITGQGLVEGNEYVVSRSWCPFSSPSNLLNDWRVELEGFDVGKYGSSRPLWDAHRFELIPPFVQACPCGIHWETCPQHG